MAKPEIGPWSEEWERVEDDAGAWREAHAAEVRAAEGEEAQALPTSTVPRPVPEVSIRDVERCYRLINLHQEQMNRIRRTP
jgi:hypothetical protein